MDARFIRYAVKNKEKNMDEDYKEVYYDEYCKTCEYKDLPETEWICDECLHIPINLYSHKPVNWKEKEKNKKEQS